MTRITVCLPPYDNFAVDDSDNVWSRSEDVDCCCVAVKGWRHPVAVSLPKDSIAYAEGKRGFVINWDVCCEACVVLI